MKENHAHLILDGSFPHNSVKSIIGRNKVNPKSRENCIDSYLPLLNILNPVFERHQATKPRLFNSEVQFQKRCEIAKLITSNMGPQYGKWPVHGRGSKTT